LTGTSHLTHLIHYPIATVTATATETGIEIEIGNENENDATSNEIASASGNETAIVLLIKIWTEIDDADLLMNDASLESDYDDAENDQDDRKLRLDSDKKRIRGSLLGRNMVRTVGAAIAFLEIVLENE